MKIYRVDNGHTYDCNVRPQTTVESLKEMLSSLCGFSPADQVLLCDGAKLDSPKTLETYGLASNNNPNTEKEVFLYYRKLLDRSAPFIDGYSLPSMDVSYPQPKPLIRTKEMEQSPLVEALKKYEYQFQHHWSTAQAISDAIDRKVMACKICVEEQRVQQRGIEAAIENLKDRLHQLVSTYTTFSNYVNQQRGVHEDLLQNFERDMTKLRDTTLHPSLRTPQCNTLIDCVPENRVRQWANECKEEHEKLKTKVQNLHLPNLLAELQHSVDQEINRAPDVDFVPLVEKLQSFAEITRDVKTRLEMFAQDYENVVGRVDEATRRLALNQPAWGLADGFEEIRVVHETHIQGLQLHDQNLKSGMNQFSSSKNQRTKSVFERLPVVSQLQSKIRDVQNTIILMGEALNRQQNAFSQLAYIRHMPIAYQAALSEVSRRKGFGKKFRKQISTFVEGLAKFREEEAARRNAFQPYARYVPKGLITGLDEPLPIIDFVLPAIDSKLPNIESSNDEEDFAMLGFEGGISDDAQFMGQPQKGGLSTLGTIQMRNTAMSNPDSSVYIERIKSLEHKLSEAFANNEEILKQSRFENSEKEKMLEEKLVELTQQKEQVLKHLDETLAKQADLVASHAQQEGVLESLRQVQQQQEIVNLERINLQSDLAKSRQQISELEKYIDNLKCDVNSLEDEVVSLTEKLAAQHDSASKEKDAMDDIVSLRADLVLANKQVEIQNGINSDLKNTIQKLKSELDSRSADLDDFLKNQAQTKHTLETKDKEIENLRAEIFLRSLKTPPAHTFAGESSELTQVLTEKENLKLEKDAIITKLMQELKEVKQHLDSKVALFVQEREEMRSSILLQEKKFDQMLLTEQLLKKKLEESKNNLEESLLVNNNNNNTTNNDSLDKIQELKDAISELQESLSETTYLLEKTKGEAHEKTEHIAILNANLMELEQKNSDIAQKLLQMENNNQGLQRNCSTLENELRKLSLEHSKTLEKGGKRDDEKARFDSTEKQKLLSEIQRLIGLSDEMQRTRNGLLEISNALKRVEPPPFSSSTYLYASTGPNPSSPSSSSSSTTQPSSTSEIEDISSLITRVNKVVERFATEQKAREAEHLALIESGKKTAEYVGRIKTLEISLEEKTKEMKAISSDLRGRIAALHFELEKEKKSEKKNTVSIAKFDFGDLVLMTKNNMGVYEAVNIRSPNYFLCEESPLIDIQMGDKVFGTVVQVLPGRAKPGNKYGLAQGTEYFELLLAKPEL